jgi:hypothetical protein
MRTTPPKNESAAPISHITTASVTMIGSTAIRPAKKVRVSRRQSTPPPSLRQCRRLHSNLGAMAQTQLHS